MAYFNGKRILNARVEGLYETGYAEGEKVGYADGYTQGEQDGYVKGETEGYAKGEADGKTAERDEFWKNYQNEGNVTQGAYMFAHNGWDDHTFEPRYSLLKLTRCDNMFNTCAVTDLKGILERQGVVFDFSQCVNMGSAFSYSKITVLPTISTVSASNLANLFYYSTALHTIDKLILKDDGTQTFSGAFGSCRALANIVIEGKIGNNINFSPCPLTHDSLMSIINHLATVSTTKTLTLGATNLAKLTDAEKAIATEKGWTLA